MSMFLRMIVLAVSPCVLYTLEAVAVTVVTRARYAAELQDFKKVWHGACNDLWTQRLCWTRTWYAGSRWVQTMRDKVL